jgi:hypothetical protein
VPPLRADGAGEGQSRSVLSVVYCMLHHHHHQNSSSEKEK